MTQVSSLPKLGAYGYVPRPHGTRSFLAVLLALLCTLALLAFLLWRKKASTQEPPDGPDGQEIDLATGLGTA